MKLQRTMQAKHTLVGAVALLFSFGGQAEELLRTRDLILNGWEIVKKTSETHRKPGLPPYETATRIIEVTIYKLAKDDQHYICSIAYDRQQDQFEESCRMATRE